MTQEKQNAVNAIEEKAGLIGDVADHIWEYAELSLQEVKSAALYCEVLEKEGFQVEKGISGIETAFSASYGQGRPMIGFLAEYDALSGRASVENTDEYSDFKRTGTDISKYDIPFIKGVSLIEKIREVQVLLGFSRTEPFSASMIRTGSNRFVSVKEDETDWYPGYNVYGEGIFIEFDGDAIDAWRSGNTALEKRVRALQENYNNSFMGSQNPRTISGKFLLLHTMSHLLIKQLSFECGYNISSLKERIYCGEAAEGKEMAGILIYTASGDSEGTLGGLVRQGRHDTFPRIYRRAVESAVTCSNDPVCSLSKGQGRDSLNLAVCYSCGLLPETCCEEFNVFLDRGVVVGTYENKKLGLFHEQLYENAGWKE